MSQSKPQSQQGKREQFDALVIGAGIAGLNYILELLQHKPKANIALIIKKDLKESNSYYAQGGMAAATEKNDSIEDHVDDTLQAGAGLSHKKVVETIVEQGADSIQTLIDFGVSFSQKDNHYDLAKEGGHSARRIYNTGDHTGKNIIKTLTTVLKEHEQVHIFENHTAIDLITQSPIHKPGEAKEVIGAYVLNEDSGKIDTLLASVTVLATGGAGKVFRYTSNPETATGDGIAMAYRAGARVGNLEFFQFHPTLLYNREKNNFLISEALRGEGAHLLTPDTHDRFMKKYAPEKMELATRDIVARAIFTEIEKSQYNFVYLDIRHRDREYLETRFPSIFKNLLSVGLDMSKDLIPVVPAAHYLCGGILTDVNGRTDLKRLYAIGETAFTGLHGANRLASNSLLEGTVMGKLAAQKSNKWLDEPIEIQNHLRDWDSTHVTDLRRASQINAHWRSLRGEMTSYAGIVRTAAGLKDLLKLILTRREMIENYYRKHAVTRDVIELRNIILVAKLIVNSAIYRKESRGTHFREDFPTQYQTSNDTILRAKETHYQYR